MLGLLRYVPAFTLLASLRNLFRQRAATLLRAATGDCDERRRRPRPSGVKGALSLPPTRDHVSASEEPC